MDHGYFDDLTRSVAGGGATRRAALGLLAGGVIAGLAARLGLGEAAEAKPRRKRRPKRQAKGELQAEGKKSKGKKGKDKGKKPKRCGALKPLCEPCKEARCNAATGEWDCHDLCAVGESCCDGHCEPPCSNGCDLEPDQNCLCAKPRGAGDVYCAGSERCGANPCAPGQEYDSVTCTCEEGPRECQPTATQCGGCCPDNTYYCAGDGVCCTTDLPDDDLYCTCASGYTVCAGKCCQHGCCGSRCCDAP